MTSVLEDEIFKYSDLSSLKLINNNIQMIESNGFKGIINLINLDLSNQLLTILLNNSFNGLINLQNCVH